MNVEAGSAHEAQKSSGSLAFRGIAEVFYKPSEFFAELKNNPRILIPYLLFAVLAFLFFYLTSDLMMEAVKSSPQYQRQMEMQGGQMPAGMEAIQKWSTIIVGSICFMLIPILYAALAMFWGNFVFAGKARFKQLLSMMIYGEILFLISSFLMVPLMIMKGSLFVSISLAALLPTPDLNSPLYVLLSKISLFQIWEFIVIGIGLSIMYALPRNKGYLIAVLSVGLLSMFHVVWTLIMSSIF